jgi:hypothetical protein
MLLLLKGIGEVFRNRMENRFFLLWMLLMFVVHSGSWNMLWAKRQLRNEM